MKKLLLLVSVLLVSIMLVSCVSYGKIKPIEFNEKSCTYEEFVDNISKLESEEDNQSGIVGEWYKLNANAKSTVKTDDSDVSVKVALSGKIYITNVTYDLKFDLEFKMEESHTEKDKKYNTKNISEGKVIFLNGCCYANIYSKQESYKGTLETTTYTSNFSINSIISLPELDLGSILDELQIESRTANYYMLKNGFGVLDIEELDNYKTEASMRCILTNDKKKLDSMEYYLSIGQDKKLSLTRLDLKKTSPAKIEVPKDAYKYQG